MKWARRECKSDRANIFRMRRSPKGRDSSGKKTRDPLPPRRYRKHPLFGEVPLIGQRKVDAAGKTYEWWDYDADFEPRMPRGAVRGDITRQVCCPMCHVPRYFFVDEDRDCVQCGTSFVFRAAEQKYWYESLKFYYHSVPIRCVSCRRQRRSDKALHEELARARTLVREEPKDPAAHLALARAIVAYHERTGQGKLDEAVAAARRTAALWPEAVESFYWEGVAQLRAGRRTKARQALASFVQSPTAERDTSGLLRRAVEHLASLDAGRL